MSRTVAGMSLVQKINSQLNNGEWTRSGKLKDKKVVFSKIWKGIAKVMAGSEIDEIQLLTFKRCYYLHLLIE